MPLQFLIALPPGAALALLYLYVAQGITPINIWQTSSFAFKVFWCALTLGHLGLILLIMIAEAYWPFQEIPPIITTTTPSVN
jgi:hypothetical protein